VLCLLAPTPLVSECTAGAVDTVTDNMKFSAKSGDLKFFSRRFAKMSCTSYIWTFFMMLLKYTEYVCNCKHI
jgi:hypothetical protein